MTAFVPVKKYFFFVATTRSIGPVCFRVGVVFERDEWNNPAERLAKLTRSSNAPVVKREKVKCSSRFSKRGLGAAFAQTRGERGNKQTHSWSTNEEKNPGGASSTTLPPSGRPCHWHCIHMMLDGDRMILRWVFHESLSSRRRRGAALLLSCSASAPAPLFSFGPGLRTTEGLLRSPTG